MGTIRKLGRFMEHFWLAVAIGTLVASIWVIAADGFAQGRHWLLFPAIAMAMFFFRRFTRRKLEAMEDRRSAR
jgi:4-amino-4-deoxy-L-arabinose transferase-like glycosyltransferase